MAKAATTLCEEACGCKPGAQRGISYCLAFFGALFVLVSVFMPGYIQTALHNGIDDYLIISSDTSEAYAGFVNNTAGDEPPTHLSVYVFHLTNAFDAWNGATPIFEERGPYWYWPTVIKFKVSWINDTLIRYKEWDAYVFDRSMSGGDEFDNITTVNIPFQGAYAALHNEDWNIALDALYDGIPEYQRLFTNKTVHELLWGYNDPQLLVASEIAALVHYNVSAWYPGLQTNQSSIEEADQTTGFCTFYTGQGDTSRMRQLVEYNGRTQLLGCAASSCPPGELLPAWETAEANKQPAASEGVQFYPGMDRTQQLPVFVEQANRAFMLETLQDSSLFGIDMYRYTIVPSQIDNATVNPANAAYDQFGPRGFINLTRTEHSMPISMSKPHFLDCDPSVLTKVAGDISPDRSLHDIYIDVEPNMGTTFNARKRLQVNMYLQELSLASLLQPKHESWFRRVKPAYYPVAWFEEAGTITESLADKFKSRVYFAQRMIRVTRYGGAVLAALCAAIIIALYPRAPAPAADGEDPLLASRANDSAAASNPHSDHKHSGNTTSGGSMPASANRELINPSS